MANYFLRCYATANGGIEFLAYPFNYNNLQPGSTRLLLRYS